MSEPHERLDEAMNDRRLELRLRWAHLAQLAHMSYPNLRRIRTGTIGLTEFAAGGIDRALQWPTGTAWSIYHGAQPPVRIEPVEPELRDDTERRLWALGESEQERWDHIKLHRRHHPQGPAEVRETG